MSSSNPSVQPPTSTNDHFDNAAEMTATEESSHSNTTEGFPWNSQVSYMTKKTPIMS